MIYHVYHVIHVLVYNVHHDIMIYMILDYRLVLLNTSTSYILVPVCYKLKIKN